jgi:NAD(P)H-flavin reductase
MENEYLGKPVKLINKTKQSNDVNLYDFRTLEKFNFIPGQFIMLSIPGIGEAPFAPISSTKRKNGFELSIKKVGTLTNALENINTNLMLEYRGPYGNGFPIKKLLRKDLVVIAGGTGIAPISSLVEYIIENRKNFGKVYLLYGAKNPDEILLKDKIRKWRKKINVMLCVEKRSQNWKEDFGYVSDVCYKIDTDIKKTIVIMCGPPVMYKNSFEELKKNGISADKVYVSVETRMKCGIGKCQHCTMGKKYTCLDGPIFRYDEIINEL